MHKLGLVREAKDQMSAQEEFIKLVAASKKKNDKYMIVFDGQKQSETNKRGLKIIYSDGVEKADGVIKKLSEHYEGKQVTVVTEDRAIIDYVRRGGLKMLSSSEFAKNLSNKSSEISEEHRIKELENLPDEYWKDYFNNE